MLDERPAIVLSVVVPAWNHGHLLKRALNSVLDQSSEECELVVVDDGSTDDTPELLEAVAFSHPAGFRWLRQDNAGAAAARNAGLRASHGSHVLFLDADDELLPGALDAICSAFRENLQASVVIGGRLNRWPDGREKRHASPGRVDEDPCRRVAAYLLDKTLSISHGAIAVERYLAENHPYPESFRGREDIPVWANWLAKGRVKTIDVPLVRIHKHPGSLRHTVKINEALEQTLVEEIFRDLPEECRKLEAPYLARRYLSLSREALRSGDRIGARRYLMAVLRSAPGQLLARGQLRKLLKAWAASLSLLR